MRLLKTFILVLLLVGRIATAIDGLLNSCVNRFFRPKSLLRLYRDDWEHIITCTGRTVTAPYMAVLRIMTGSGGLLAVGKVVRRQVYLSGKCATGSVLGDSAKPLNTLLHSLVGTTGTHAHLTNTRMRVQNLFNHQTNPQIHH
jgi:hypothetical protein